MTEIGYYSILISLFLSVYCGLASILSIKNRRAEVIASAENAAIAVFVFLSLSVTAMIYALITRNFQIEYVARYTSRSLSLLYTLTAFYAGQEGSCIWRRIQFENFSLSEHKSWLSRTSSKKQKLLWQRSQHWQSLRPCGF